VAEPAGCRQYSGSRGFLGRAGLKNGVVFMRALSHVRGFWSACGMCSCA